MVLDSKARQSCIRQGFVSCEGRRVNGKPLDGFS